MEMIESAFYIIAALVLIVIVLVGVFALVDALSKDGGIGWWMLAFFLVFVILNLLN